MTSSVTTNNELSNELTRIDRAVNQRMGEHGLCNTITQLVKTDNEGVLFQTTVLETAGYTAEQAIQVVWTRTGV